MTVRLNDVCTNNMTENFIEMLLEVSEEVGELRKDNEILKKKIEVILATERTSALCASH